MWAAGTARKGNRHANEQQYSENGQQPQPPWPVVRGRSVLDLHTLHDQADSELDRQAHNRGIRAYHRAGRFMNGEGEFYGSQALNAGQQAQGYSVPSEMGCACPVAAALSAKGLAERRHALLGFLRPL